MYDYRECFICGLCKDLLTTPVKFHGCPHYFDLLCIHKRFGQQPLGVNLFCHHCQKVLPRVSQALTYMTPVPDFHYFITKTLPFSPTERRNYFLKSLMNTKIALAIRNKNIASGKCDLKKYS